MTACFPNFTRSSSFLIILPASWHSPYYLKLLLR
jgi:hypothetical protein